MGGNIIIDLHAGYPDSPLKYLRISEVRRHNRPSASGTEEEMENKAPDS